jgi:transcription elongation factor Elf1
MKNDIRISVPAYDFGKDCPVCGSSNTVFQKDGSELREDGEMVFIWRCSMCGREYEVPSKEISQRMYVMKRRFIEKFPELITCGVIMALAGFGAVSLFIIFMVSIFK